LHVTVALIGAGAAVLAARRRRYGWTARRVLLSGALAISFGLFCWGIRWQPWANRLLLPLVLVATPLVGWTLAKASPRMRVTLMGLLGTIGIFYSFTSVRRPFIAHPQAPSLTIFGRTREELYFADDEIENGRGELKERYENLLQQAAENDCAHLALVSQEYDPEYLLWVTLDRWRRPVQISNVDVANPSRLAAPEGPDSSPCGLVELMGRHRYTPLPSAR
jgi:hypothetical protein